MNILKLMSSGFLLNIIIYFFMLGIKRGKQKALRALFICTAALLLFSFLIGGWKGMGIGVISLGMFMASLVMLIFVKIIKRNTL